MSKKVTKTDLPENALPLTRIQKLIGNLMLKSKHTKPCCYLEAQADLTDLGTVRKKYCKQAGTRVTTNDFFFHAIAEAVKQFPLMAGRLDDDKQNVIITDQVGLGFAVAAPQGLVVPVIKNITEKSLPQIAKNSNELLLKARANKLVPDDFDNDNIVLSSLGMYGVHSFLAIAPPGATCIISMGKPIEKIIPTKEGFIPRKMMSVALAVDQRFITEFYAAGFLKCFIEKLETPQTLLDD